MIDFIEYVVAELKSKRLSKTDAAGLVRQFSLRPAGSAAASVIHPLLQRNTSDLSGQRYGSTFTGEEFFLADHQVKPDGQAGHKVLPGVAYLEMARAAVEDALPQHSGATAVLELHNTVWAQPIVVDESKQVSIALLASDDDRIDYEIYSGDADRETVHCQGRATFSAGPAPARLDLEQLQTGMAQGTMEAHSLYATCARMGLIYGPSFQGVTAVHRGNGEVLARLRLPDTAAATAADYVLHPSLMDGALQAAVGLIDDGADATQPRLPFALETLRIVAPCRPEMFAWVRYAPGSRASDNVVKLDIDLCDEHGNVCVQLRGFSSRVLAAAPQARAAGSLFAAPVWQTSSVAAAANAADYAEQHVILCDLSHVDTKELGSHGLSLDAGEQKNIAQRYSEYALACFEWIQAIIQRKPQGKVLVQIVVADQQEQALLAGLTGLLKTAAMENPQLAGQLILVPADVSSAELGRCLQDEQRGGRETLIRYRDGARQVLRWQEVTPAEAPIAFREQGVYLITGGFGGLGTIFAREILARTRDARVVLTGRAALTADRQAFLDAQDGRVSYRQVDLGDADRVAQLIAGIEEEHGRLDGILHSAGMIADGFILMKTGAEFSEVLAPKVTGTFHLDQATQHVELDFFVLFSSVAAAMGNLGQADYAAANGFLDQFAAYRNAQVAASERHGRTRSINWPLWQAGGMSVDAVSQERLRQTTGMQPLETATGIDAFYRSLAFPHDQVLVAEGDLTQLRRALLEGPRVPEAAEPAAVVAVDAAGLVEKTQDYLRKQLSELLKVPAHKIDPRAALENYGIDSMLAMKLTNQLEKTFGSLSKTLFFEYQTIRELADYFLASHAAQLTALFSPAATRAAEAVVVPAQVVPAAPPKLVSSRRFSRPRSAAPGPAPDDDPIAIIGLSGRYPEAVDLNAYWQNLRAGKDCIVEVPKDRWDWKEYFTEDRTRSGHHFSKWGGFIEGVDEFDPLFFNISPLEAELMDPQERLFLQHAWMAVEDAGYTRATLQVPSAQDLPGQVGVYVGVMYVEYQLFGADASARGKRMGIVGSAASVANRVSYALNLHGPSMTVDTMCSSSLTAIHLACQDLKQGRTSLAIAGGVNVTIHPNKYLVLSGGQFISSDGHCQSFGEGGDGYIPGEGVGAVVLKRLSEAERDGDHVYGVIRGTALTHGGKTNGYSVPNPQAQASAISRALAESKTDARHISYIEAHGTGTKLGDPIEIAALNKAFHPYTEETGFCLIGSAKSNIGHCESAAGIAGLTKVLLQMQHREIVPSLHSAQLNPHIDFPRSPFVVNQSLQPWEQPVIDGRTLPRLAGISSFGAGGSNAHVIVEEYQPPVRQPLAFDEIVILLSARTPEQLRQKAEDLLAFVQPRLHELDLASVAYTLQTGRETMDERLGFVVTSAAQLAEKLQAWVAGEEGIEDAWQGRVKRNSEALSLFSTDADLQQTVEKWLTNQKFSKLLDLWVRGLEVDWSRLYDRTRPQRVSLPTYPFARERYWIDVAAATPVAANGTMHSAAVAVLHPLLHSNTSDLSEQRYSSTFTGEEFFLADHQVKPEGRAALKVLPGVASLEMARAAIEQALPARPEATVLELRNTVWAQPIVVSGTKQVSIALLAGDDDQIDYEIYSQDADEEIVHCQGRAAFSHQPAPARIDLAQLEGEMTQRTLDAASVYAACARMGLAYGPSFRSVAALHRGNGQVLARLRLPDVVAEQANDYVLHPSLMDGALQAAIGLIEGDLAVTQPRLPFALETLRILAPCSGEMVAWVRYAAGSQAADNVVKLDADLCDEQGNVCVQLHGFASRVLSHETIRTADAQEPAIGSLLAAPVWQASDGGAGGSEYAEHHVILCEVAAVAEGPNVLSLDGGQEEKNIARRYSEYAVACFERIQSILRGKPQGRVLVQIVAADQQEQSLFAGLSGLLKTAALENPQFRGQLILVPAQTTSGELSRRLQDEKSRGLDALVRYRDGVRQVLRWQEVPRETAPIAFREQGVYLITGGFGGLGTLFAGEVVKQTRDARVVLTGRSPLSSDKQAILDAQHGRLSYRQVDLGDPEQVRQLVAGIQEEHGRLDGILHSAGMIADRFILKKTAAEFVDVLAPKVTGTFHLDQATADVTLDFFVLFSSVAGAMGNLGQADYATANGFMDCFAAYRNGQVAAGQRHGRTRSINWPLWQDGGMGIAPAAQELLQETTGVRPMQTATGMEAFHRALALPHDQVLVAEGDLTRMRAAMLAGPAVPAASPEAAPPVAAAANDAETLNEKTQDYLRGQLSGLLKLPAHRIDPHAALENYGIDSVLAMKLTNQLETTFGSLSKTLFFEYQTIAALAGYFVKAHAATVREAVGLVDEAPRAKAAVPAAVEKNQPAPKRRKKNRFSGSGAGSATRQQQDIAIIGLAGRYPQAENLREFWKNLRNGLDCITEIPSDRWDHSLYFDLDPNKPGKTYSKWGGFIADVDKFDPLFFNISPKEAALVDPQERLFLETAWQTIEDAGYTKESISGSRVGVYVGVMWGQYELFGAESIARGETAVPVASHASIANRVSYFFDLRGPSIALDTMCSSSLTAIHMACEELRKGEIDSAIAGGVNVTIHPYKYLSLSQGKFVASDGRCRSFGAGGDGYVPGEGVGAVLLKPLDKALRDGDQVYAVIKSSSLNHGGKTNGYTVPNPIAQGELIRDALHKANIDPKTLSYVETHGTGTSLGDPIEITGLLRAFEGSAAEKQFLPIGSVKSNIGHLESAAGIAALTKALLQLRHGQLVPSLHADPLNPNISFEDSPFYVQTGLTEWKRTAAHPRRAGVSSFGAGGSNAHLILEEYAGAREEESGPQTTAPEAFVLSARDADALRRYAGQIVTFLDEDSSLSLADMAYTSQVGRTPMDARLVVVASSVADLGRKLHEWIAAGKNDSSELDGVFYGNLRESGHGAGNLIAGKAGKAFVDALLANGDLEKIAGLWTLGVDVDWSLLNRPTSAKRVSLPTYPFAKERCWVYQGTPSIRPVEERTPAAATEEKQKTVYVPQWTPKALAVPDGQRAAVGPVLLLDASADLFLAMSRRGGDPVVLVQPGKAFEEVGPNHYAVDPEREEQFHQLVETLKGKGLLPRAIVHHAAEVCDLEIEQDVARHLSHGFYALFSLCRTLLPEASQLRVLSLFSSLDEGQAPLGAAIGGFLRTLTLESPRSQARAIEIASALDSEAKAALIRDELSAGDWAPQAEEVRYRGTARSIRTLVPQRPAGQQLSALPIKQNGVYLITGGFGGLGLIFAEYLAKTYQARLVLVGRSIREEKLRRLEGHGAEILSLQADVSSRADMERVVREAKGRFSRIDGVIHSAGVNRDAFILRKTREEIEAVLAPKVYGTINLDLATRGEDLDFFILFSSVAGVMGNVGQCDYAYGNRFLDSFAENREALTRAQQRSGRTLSIDWPLWQDGGMGISPDDVTLLEQRTGISPLPTPDGIQYFEDFLRAELVQGVAFYGIASRIAASVAQQPIAQQPIGRQPATVPNDIPFSGGAVDPTALHARTEGYLKALLGEALGLAPERIGSSDRLESFGIDSVMINRINAKLEHDLGALPKTLLYEHETVRELATFLVRESREALLALLGGAQAILPAPSIEAAAAIQPVLAIVPAEEPVQPAAETRDRLITTSDRDDREPIAIIGIHGYYPHSATLGEYWDNLKNGRDLIDLVPSGRWDAEALYDPDPAAALDGKIYCKWGGFLDDHDKFDPRFFRIPAAEAAMIDPQERLFLQSVWAAIEDAGYTRESLRKRFAKAKSADVGVFVGVTTNSYQMVAAEAGVTGPGTLPWSIANRVSYVFDFNGPSMPIDTACSSSLVALHLACESLRRSECQVAVAGGVNLYLHPSKYQSLCQKRSLSTTGKCTSYGAGDDGFVPGEGVGTVVLKPLSRAIADGDRIHAVIAASAYDHSGRSNGYSAPNPNSQANLIRRTLEKAGIHPESISYVEGHGTGTQLGDSLEIAALTQAFRAQTSKEHFCSVGSVKANLGHSESAAGIAGLAKVVLQLQHRQLAPSLHSDDVNPNIELEASPFYLQHGLSEWKSSPAHPRRALINSFGAGGVNACVVVEEYESATAAAETPVAGPCVFTLSAKNDERLQDYVARLLAHLRGEPATDLASLCYTLQTGREAMEERLALVVSTVDELIDRLEEWTSRGAAADVHRGSVGKRRGSKRSSDLGERSLTELAAMWVAGQDVDWERLYPSHPPRRIALPTYPFARERYWVSASPVPEKQAIPQARLHPLVSYNSSTLREISFSSSLSDTAFYAADHAVNDERIFPGAGFLEMACIAGNIAGEQKVRKIRDIVWILPLSFRNGPRVVRTALKPLGDCVEYVVSSFDDDNETVVHSEGRLVFGSGRADASDAGSRMSLDALKALCATPQDGAAIYEKYREHGFHYGSSFRTIQEIYVNDSFALSRLSIAESLKDEFGQFVLHPSILDGALQTAAGLVGNLASPVPYLPFALDEIEILRPLPQTCYAYVERAGAPMQNHAGVTKFNIRLLNESGDVLLQFTNLYVRPLAQPPAKSPSIIEAEPAGQDRLLHLSGERIQ